MTMRCRRELVGVGAQCWIKVKVHMVEFLWPVWGEPVAGVISLLPGLAISPWLLLRILSLMEVGLFLCNTNPHPHHPLRISPVTLVSSVHTHPHPITLSLMMRSQADAQSALSVRVAAWAVEVLAGKDLFGQRQMGEGELYEQVKVVGLSLLGSQLAQTSGYQLCPNWDFLSW